MSINRRTMLKSGGFAASTFALAAGCSKEVAPHSTQLAEMDGVETAAKIKSGEISSQEAVDAAIERAKRIDPEINAIAFKTFKKASDEAAGEHSGPFAGVPSFVKDLDDVTGVPSGFGSRAFPGYKGAEQVPFINTLLDMGIVSLGKSTTPEFGLSATTEPLSTGATRNPWNTDHSTGGSSGGAAALVASGVVPIAHASDGGGSIRIPASCCGNVGLKVSNNRYPIARPNNVGPVDLSVHGIQSRTVRDTAVSVAAMEQPADVSGLPAVGLVEGPGKKRLRIGYFAKSLIDAPIDNDVVAITTQTAQQCAAMGHEVEEMEFSFDPQFADDFLLYWAAFAESAVSFWESKTHLPRNGLAFEPLTLGLADLFKENAEKLPDAVARLQGFAGLLNEQAFSNFDVVLSPVLASPPPPIGYLGGGVEYETIIQRLTDYVQFTAFYNVSGTPAISLPLGMSSGGLPIGSMFAAPMGAERTLLELAYEFEEAHPWKGRRAPLFG